MIESLTKEQEEQVSIWRKRWLEIGSSTEPANRPLVEKTIAEFYKRLEKGCPEFIWVDSPADAACTIECLSRLEKMPSSKSDQHFENWDKYKAKVRSSMKSLYNNTFFCGAQDSYWVAYYKFCNEVVGVKYSENDFDMLQLWSDLCQSSGWWWPYENVCIVSDRPSAVKWDTRQEPYVLHSEDGPALQYRDGWAVHCWRGVRVPSNWIEDKENVDPSLALTWENIEQRRVLSEILGWDKVLDQLNPKVIDTDDDPMIGELLEVDLPDAPGEKFLRVKCGTGRMFVIPVGRDFSTALEANAATYGLDPSVMRGYEVRT